MDVWDIYRDRVVAHGETKRGATLSKERHFLLNHLPDSLSYQNVIIYNPDHGYNITSHDAIAAAERKDVGIINSDNLNEKYVISMPGDDIENGSLIFWMDQYWLVSERDANTTMYTKAKILQCNHLLKWVSDDNEIIEQWSIVEDGTKLKRICICAIVWYNGNVVQKEFL